MTPVLDRVSGTLSRYNMCAPGQHVAIAVSGGADSVCLLYLLHQLAGSWNITLSVAHLNHKLRGSESDGDAEFVKKMAENFGLPFHYKEVECLRSKATSNRRAAMLAIDFLTPWMRIASQQGTRNRTRQRQFFIDCFAGQGQQGWRGCFRSQVAAFGR